MCQELRVRFGGDTAKRCTSLNRRGGERRIASSGAGEPDGAVQWSVGRVQWPVSPRERAAVLSDHKGFAARGPAAAARWSRLGGEEEGGETVVGSLGGVRIGSDVL